MKEDEKKGAALLQEAAAKDDPAAMYHLGYCYSRGRGVAENYYKGKEWIRRAYDKGNKKAVRYMDDLYGN